MGCKRSQVQVLSSRPLDSFECFVYTAGFETFHGEAKDGTLSLMLNRKLSRRHLILSSIIVSNFIPAAAQASFTDVPSGQAYFDAIVYVQAEGIVSGYPDGSYHPEKTINRAEFTKIIVGSAFGTDSIHVSGKAVFEDVNGSEWFAPYIEKAVQEHIVSGYGVTDAMLPTFTPEDRLGTPFFPSHPINFAEAAKILVKTFNIPMDESDERGNWWDHIYRDGSGAWWKGYVNALLRDNVFPPNWLPDSPVTRGEMAEMIYRLKTGKASSQKVLVVEHPITTSTLTIFFYSKNDVEQLTYEATFPVTRIVSKTPTIADATLKALFYGPTPAEQEKGAHTLYALSALREYYLGITVRDGVAIVNFKPEALEYLNAAAATQMQVKAAIEATLKHFPNIKSVEYSINGKIYMHWDA